MVAEVRLQVLADIASQLETICLREGVHNPGVANWSMALVDSYPWKCSLKMWSPVIYLAVGTVVGETSMAQQRDDNWNLLN